MYKICIRYDPLNSFIKMKCLLIICDVEGKVYNSPKKTGLHDLTCFLVGTVDINKTLNASHVKLFQVFNMLSLISIPDRKIKTIRKRLLPQMDYYLKSYKCEGFVFSSWSTYDKRMLSPILDDVNTCFHLDLLRVARKEFHKKIDKFSISYLMKRYKSKSKQEHYAFKDTVFTIDILKCLMKEKKTGRITSLGTDLPEKHLKEFFQLPSIQGSITRINSKNLEETLETLSSSSLLSSWSSSLSEIFQQVDFKTYDVVIQKRNVYKVRVGWENTQDQDFKGKGLYHLNNSSFELIRDQELKKSILNNIIKQKTAKKISSPNFKPMIFPQSLET